MIDTVRAVLLRGWDGWLGWVAIGFITWVLYLLLHAGKAGCAVLCG